VSKDLGYVTDRPYIPLNLEVNMAWDRASPLGSPDDLGVALAQNRDLKALVVHGYHDLVTNYFLTRYVLEQSVLGPEARKRLFFGNYDGGHMFYLRSASRAERAYPAASRLALPPAAVVSIVITRSVAKRAR